MAVRWDESRQRWEAAMEAGWTRKGTRRRVRKFVSIPGRRGEQKAKALLREMQLAAVPPEGAGAITVKTWADRWLSITVSNVRPTTWANNRSQVNRWIVPTIGHRRLDQLTPADVRTVSRAMLTAGLKPSTAQRAHMVLIKMLRDALVEGYTVPPRLLELDAPERGENDRAAIPLDDALAILAAAAKHPDASRWVAALLQGVRPAECRGLTRDCIDLDAGTMDISWQLKPLPYNTPRMRGSGFRVPVGYTARHLVDSYHLVRPKTGKGQRIIPLVPWMTAALREWLTSTPPNAYGLVWPGAFGRPLNEVDDRQAWRDLCAEAEVKAYDLYEARHTTATLLLQAGVDMEVIKAILGHASILSTVSYAHVETALTRQALTGLAETLGLG